MNHNEELIMKYGNIVKPKKGFEDMCHLIEQELDGKLLDFGLVLDPMRKFLYYNINMYLIEKKINLNEDKLDIILYIIPKDGKGSKYYKERYTLNSISGYKDYIYVILIKQCEYFMSCNCDVLFIDLAIERGVSDTDKKNQSMEYLTYLTRIEAKENNYYKDGIKTDKFNITFK